MAKKRAVVKKKSTLKKRSSTKKRAPAKKRRTVGKTISAKMTCPDCGHTQMMKKMGNKPADSYHCKGCDKDIDSKKCCAYCDYSNKPCPCCK